MTNLFGGPTVDQLKGTLFARMSELGGTYLEADYSGGNDEGGVEQIKLYRIDFEKDGPVKTLVDFPASESEWNDDPNSTTLYDLCNDILGTEFYTWAGEFYAHGTLYADTEERKVYREGEIQSGYDSDAAEY